MRALSVCAFLALTACGTPREPKVETVYVDRPVSVSCVPESFVIERSFPDTDAALKAAAGPGEMLQLLAGGRVLREQAWAEAIPVLRACRKATPPAP